MKNGLYQNIYINSIFGIIFGLLSFFLCFINVFSDPGALPKSDLLIFPNAVFKERIFQKKNSIVILGRKAKIKYCKSCFILRPTTTSHCEKCNNCVEKFDHHCPWIGNCIGRNNYRDIFSVSSPFLVFT